MLRTVVAGLVVASLVSWVGSVSAGTVLINNGLAPPNLLNVIDDGTYASDSVVVHNEDCPPAGGTWEDFCPEPGASTEVALVEGGAVGLGLTVVGSSILTMSGGSVTGTVEGGSSATINMSGGSITEYLVAYGNVAMSGGIVGFNISARDSAIVAMSGGTVESHLFAGWDSTVTMTGGDVLGKLEASGSATVTMSGGTVGENILAYETSIIKIEGTNFMVSTGGSPVAVPNGDLSASTGRLTGTLDSGDPIDNIFFQGGGSYTGIITLVPEPSAVFLQIAAFTTLVGLAARRVGALRKQAALEL